MIRIPNPKRPAIIEAWCGEAKRCGRALFEDLKVEDEGGALKIIFVFNSEGGAASWLRAIIDNLAIRLELDGFQQSRDIYGPYSQFGPRRRRRVFTKRGSVAELAA